MQQIIENSLVILEQYPPSVEKQQAMLLVYALASNFKNKSTAITGSSTLYFYNYPQELTDE